MFCFLIRNENERSLGDFVIGAREIKKQLENEASIQRKKLPKVIYINTTIKLNIFESNSTE
jgi:hypothetical protein